MYIRRKDNKKKRNGASKHSNSKEESSEQATCTGLVSRMIGRILCLSGMVSQVNGVSYSKYEERMNAE